MKPSDMTEEQIQEILKNADLTTPKKVKVMLDLLDSLCDSTKEERDIIIHVLGNWIIFNTKEGCEFDALSSIHDCIQDVFNDLSESDRLIQYKREMRKEFKGGQ